jgi:hypothetical protein
MSITGTLPAPFKQRRSAVRDPFAVVIEKYLHEQAASGRGALKMRAHPDGDSVCFASHNAHGDTFDIALLRLARSLMEDERFASSLLERLTTIRSVR